VTDHPKLGQLNAQRIRTNSLSSEALVVDAIAPRNTVQRMLSEIDDAHLRTDIAKLSSFWNRNYRSPWGLASSNWVHDTVRDVSVETLFHRAALIL
jgi:leucyl aminopeptidase